MCNSGMAWIWSGEDTIELSRTHEPLKPCHLSTQTIWRLSTQIIYRTRYLYNPCIAGVKRFDRPQSPNRRARWSVPVRTRPHWLRHFFDTTVHPAHALRRPQENGLWGLTPGWWYPWSIAMHFYCSRPENCVNLSAAMAKNPTKPSLLKQPVGAWLVLFWKGCNPTVNNLPVSKTKSGQHHFPPSFLEVSELA